MRFLKLLLILACIPAHAAVIEGRATVVDGDTIAVEGTTPRIRLDAIDAPESSQGCFDHAGSRYLCGTRAAESLADIIGRNGRVSCTEKERDRYGRIVAVCFVGATDINREMVRRGWAIEFKRYSDGRYAGAEAEAKAAKVGLWAGTFDEPAEWRKSKRVGEVMEEPPAARASIAPLGLMTAAAAAAGKMPLTTTATSCKAVKSCQEAVILWCSGYSRADADGDGIPCENVCKTLAQVEPIKRQIGCER
jgi:endonuclease YncB( thermonuclease family)